MHRDEFVATWNEAASLEEFLETTGYTYGTAVQSASRYRRRGEYLKYWPKPSKPAHPPKPKRITLKEKREAEMHRERDAEINAETSIAAMFRSEDTARFRRF
jgi:hypothetical protein